MAVTTFYIDGINGDDANNGSTRQLAKKTIWQAIVECVEADTALGDGITFEISGGLAGITYQETHNLLMSNAAVHYTGDVPSISTTTGVPNGTAIAPVIFKGSSEPFYNGKVTLDHSAVTNYKTYGGLVVSRLIYGEIRDFKVIGGSATKDDVQVVSGSDNSIIENLELLEYGAHGIQLVNADNCIVRRNKLFSNTGLGTSSAIKVGTGSLSAVVHHNHVKDAGGTGTALHFGIYAAGGTGHAFFNNEVSGCTGPAMGVTAGGVLAECYNNILYGCNKHALMFETGSTITPAASNNNTLHKVSGAVVGEVSTFSTVSATYDANTVQDLTLAQWQVSTGTPDLSSVDDLPDQAGIASSMPRPESVQFRAGTNTPLTSHSVTKDILGATTPESGEQTNMGAYQTRYYMPGEGAKAAVVQPMYKGDFILPVTVG